MKTYLVLPFLVIVLLNVTPKIYANLNSEDLAKRKESQQEETTKTDVIRNYTVEKRDEAARKIKGKLNSLDTRIEALEGRIDKNWDNMDKAARLRARNTLTSLRRQRIRVAEWYGSMKNSSTEAWGHMKKGFSDAYSLLQNSWEKAKQEYE